MNIESSVDKAIKAVCPIQGVSFGTLTNKATWSIQFNDEATAQQRLDAQAVLDAFDAAAAEEPAVESAAAMLGRQREAALEDLDAMIAALPAAQQKPLRLIQQLLKD